jgi:hypothetical protein
MGGRKQRHCRDTVIWGEASGRSRFSYTAVLKPRARDETETVEVLPRSKLVGRCFLSRASNAQVQRIFAAWSPRLAAQRKCSYEFLTGVFSSFCPWGDIPPS